MKKTILLVVLMAHTLPNCALSSSCEIVRLSDIGWTDVSATTAVAKELLQKLGYKAEILLLSAPVTFAGLKNNDVDVFLGNWMPTQEADIRPFLDDGSVVQLKRNLQGAVFGLAVPDYVYETGVHTLADLSRHKDKFDRIIYGIEAGNDGNRIALELIKKDAFGLKDFRLVESSEQAMLMEVNNAVKRRNFIVFLGWAPHPMNLSINMRYLAGADEYFGPHEGGSEVYTVVRRDFVKDCPNLAQFFKNLVFTLDMENQIMSLILNDRLSPSQAAQAWLKNNDANVKAWLLGVMPKEGAGALDDDEPLAINKVAFKAPVGWMLEKIVRFLTDHFSPHLRKFSMTLEKIINLVVRGILFVHWSLAILFFCACAFAYQRSLKLAVLMALGLLLIVNLGLWEETIKTLVLVILASLFAIAIGVPLGILAARRPWFYAIMRPILDLAQTIPTFVYLIPTLMLFGLGVVPGLISTVIFAIAAPIRLTFLGLKNVPADLIEASVSFGATKFQTLMRVELPCARPSILAGFSQCIMLSLSMVVIAALVGAEGLGTPVVRALNTVNLVQGFESGIAIVILAILLDRTLNTKHP